MKSDVNGFGVLLELPKMLEPPDEGAGVVPNIEPVDAEGLAPNRLVPVDGPAVGL